LISRCFAWRSKPPFRAQGGRPAFDHVLMFKVLILQAMHALSDERTEFLIKDRLSFMRFLGLGLADTVPDANTIWTFREALKKADAIDSLFRRFDEALRSEGFLAMSGQIVDATIVATQTTQHDRREEGDQGRPDSRRLEGQACEARAERPGCALDGQILQGEAA
jgi:transposase